MTESTRTAPQNRWRTIDIVVAAVLAVVFGVVFWAWNQLWNTLAILGETPAKALVTSVWLIPAVLGPLVIRKAGAGVFTETVAATISFLLGSQWGLITLVYGLLQGAAGEAPFAATGYRSWRLPQALFGGALAGGAAALLDISLFYPAMTFWWKLTYGVIAVASGAVIAGLGSWLLVRALAGTGVLDRFPAGRDRATV